MELEKVQKLKVALASVNPWEVQDVWRVKRHVKVYVCRFCQHEYERRGVEFQHAADCPWLAAFLEVGRPEGMR